MEKNFYNKEPLYIYNGIPVFSETNNYVKNYEQIASDHISAITTENKNPFIEDELWIKLENSTRSLLIKYLAPNSKVLDVGVGLGRLLSDLNQYQRFGIDISLDYLEIAKRKGINVTYSLIEDMPYANNTFDGIVCCDVLEHVLELDFCVKEILRVLKPGGFLFIRVPYKEDLEVYLDNGLPYEFIHLRNFDENSIRLYFSKIYDCKICEYSTVAPYWQSPSRLKFRLPKRDNQLLNLLNREELENLDENDLFIINTISKISEEEFINWFGKIKKDRKRLYDILSTFFVMDIEMNVVIKKKDL